MRYSYLHAKSAVRAREAAQKPSEKAGTRNVNLIANRVRTLRMLEASKLSRALRAGVAVGPASRPPCGSSRYRVFISVTCSFTESRACCRSLATRPRDLKKRSSSSQRRCNLRTEPDPTRKNLHTRTRRKPVYEYSIQYQLSKHKTIGNKRWKRQTATAEQPVRRSA